MEEDTNLIWKTEAVKTEKGAEAYFTALWAAQD
jgi:hypothetical protein